MIPCPATNVPPLPGTKKPFSKKRKPVMILGDRTTLSSLQSGPSAILTGLAQVRTPALPNNLLVRGA